MNNLKPLTIAYLRVSTDKQSLDSQELEIRRYCAKENLVIDQVISLMAPTSRSADERQLHELLRRLRVGDTIIVAELSRLGRNTSELLVFVKKITEAGIRLIICRERLDLRKDNQDDVANHIALVIFSLLADIEKRRIIQRTKDGLQAVLNRGGSLGRPKGKLSTSLYDPHRATIIKLLQQKVSPSNIIRIIGVGKTRSLFDYVKSRKLRT